MTVKNNPQYGSRTGLQKVIHTLSVKLKLWLCGFFPLQQIACFSPQHGISNLFFSEIKNETVNNQSRTKKKLTYPLKTEEDIKTILAIANVLCVPLAMTFACIVFFIIVFILKAIGLI